MSALSHRSYQTVLGALIAALVIAVLPAAAAAAQPDAHGLPAARVNAPGTDVAAPDQQAPRVDRTAPVGPAPKADDSGPTVTLLALIALALGLAGVGFASWLAVSRKRGRATV